MWPNPQETIDLVTFTEETVTWKISKLFNPTIPGVHELTKHTQKILQHLL